MRARVKVALVAGDFMSEQEASPAMSATTMRANRRGNPDLSPHGKGDIPARTRVARDGQM
jgi:hypothetical protein